MQREQPPATANAYAPPSAAVEFASTNASEFERHSERRRWWAAHRRQYNLALFVAGWTGYAITLVVMWTAPAERWHDIFGKPPEYSFVQMIAEGIEYLVYMGIANVCYGLGSLSERILQPGNADAYRVSIFWFGTALSVAVPLLASAAVGFMLYR